MSDDKQRREAIEYLGELITDIPVAMLTTCSRDHALHSRPMVNVNTNFQGELWFLTHDHDPKVEEIRGNPQLNVAFASPERRRYVSVSGTGKIVKDQKRCELLWTDDCQPWLPSGPSDENLALIKVEVERAEYWDASKSTMVAIGGFFKGLTGGQSSAPVEHEKFDWHPASGPPGE